MKKSQARLRKIYNRQVALQYLVRKFSVAQRGVDPNKKPGYSRYEQLGNARDRAFERLKVLANQMSLTTSYEENNH